MKKLCRNEIGGQKWVGRPYFISIKSGLIEISLSKRNYGIAKISLGVRKFRWECENFAMPYQNSLFPYAGYCGFCSIGHCSLHPTACYFFFLFSSCFEILHSRLAEIDIRPYKIDGNQPDFGYD